LKGGDEITEGKKSGGKEVQRRVIERVYLCDNMLKKRDFVRNISRNLTGNKVMRMN